MTIQDQCEWAVCYLGLSPAEFWDLTLYDWSFYLIKLNIQTTKRQLESDEANYKYGSLMSLIANCNRDPKKKPTPFEVSDFVVLRGDKNVKEEIKKLDIKEVKKRLGSKWKLN